MGPACRGPLGAAQAKRRERGGGPVKWGGPRGEPSGPRGGPPASRLHRESESRAQGAVLCMMSGHLMPHFRDGMAGGAGPLKPLGGFPTPRRPPPLKVRSAPTSQEGCARTMGLLDPQPRSGKVGPDPGALNSSDGVSVSIHLSAPSLCMLQVGGLAQV